MSEAATRSYTGVERAAVLMMLVGEDEATAILQKLDPEEVRELGAAMIAVADVSEQEMADVLEDFVGRARTRTGIQFDPKPQVEALMTRALGASKAESVLTRIVPQDTAGELEMLQWLEPADIARIIADEHPQIGAVLIANCDPAVAGQVLELLPDAMQPELLHRVAKLGPVSPEAIETLKTVVAAHNGRRQAPGLTLGGTREAAKILQGARKATEARVMPKLFKIDKDVAKQIEEAMFVFDNLLEMDDKNLGTMIRNVDGEVLVKALKGVDEAVRDRFLGCMSARAADGIRDEMESRGPMKLAEVLEAQKAMIAVARQLAKDGTIQMGASEDDYV
jgi:flagellar motor switch protein FliG